MLNPEEINFQEIGFHVGLEIHHQIRSQRKLFCHCPPEMVPNNNPPDYRFERYFRPVLGEMGDFDPGMLIEYEKGYRVIYNAYERCDCIYEQDEMPPMHPDLEALMRGYELGHWLNCSAMIDEIIFARKQYLDGSITTGFQRTTIVARDGWVKIDGERVSVTNITVEEDSARKIRTENHGRTVYYNLDRLGVPLVEVITDHMDIDNPEKLIKTAKTIGLVLRSSGIGRRGIGTARQDVNISINGGDRVELKGVQNLDWFDKLCRHEICRQDSLLKIAAELKARGAQKSDFEHTYIDISDIFPDLPEEKIVMGIRLPKLTGILGWEEQPNKDFGQDIFEKASLISGVPMEHLFHSDEFDPKAHRRIHEELLFAKKIKNRAPDVHPNFFFKAITSDIHAEIQKTLQLGESDGYVIAMASQKWAIHAVKKVIERIKMAFDGVPQETRRALSDGNSDFLRVIHGMDRLYPDTDTPVLDMDMNKVNKLADKVGKRPWEYEQEYGKLYGLSFDQIGQLIRHNYIPLFEELVKIHKIPASRIYKFLEETTLSLVREHIDLNTLPKEMMIELLIRADKGHYDWAILPELIKTTINNPKMTIEEVLNGLGVVSNVDDDALMQLYKEATEVYQVFEKRGKKYSNKSLDDPLKYKINQITGIIMRKINHGYSGAKVFQYVKQQIDTKGS
ncbi:MAG: hypothetical protein ACTSVZ_06345 [Promethearchaeota archaeon]